MAGGRCGQGRHPGGCRNARLHASAADPENTQETSQRTLSPFLTAAASGLFEESLVEESSQAGAGDVDRGLVGGQAEVLVQVMDAERLLGVVVERGHDALVDGRGGGLRGSGSGPRVG